MAAGLRKLDRDPDASQRTLRNWEHLRRPEFSLTPVRSTAVATTLTADDFMLNCTGGSFAVNLPTASGIPGRPYVIKKSNAGTITVTPNGTQTIDGAASLAVTSAAVARLISDDTGNWLRF